VLGTALAKSILISRQRNEKSASPGGSVQTAWIWSGSTTMASIVNGWRVCVSRVAARNASILSVRRRHRRSSRLTVKNQHPPGTKARR